MSVTLRYDAKFHADETPAFAVDLVTSPVMPHRIAYTGVAGQLDASTTVVIDECYSDRRALVAGTYTMDLSALTSTLGTTKNFTGKKVKGFMALAAPTNTAGIIMRYGASNGYLIFTTDTGEVTLWPGMPVLFMCGNNLAAIDATHKNIAFTSVLDTDAEFEIILAVGT